MQRGGGLVCVWGGVTGAGNEQEAGRRKQAGGGF